MAPTARIHESGGLMMAVNSSIPNIPRLLMVKVLPSQSAWLQFFIFCFLREFFYFSTNL